MHRFTQVANLIRHLLDNFQQVTSCVTVLWQHLPCHVISAA